MLSSIHLHNFGPYARRTLTFNPGGSTVVSGRSQSGKTTILSAICFCLWGTDRSGRPVQPDVIHQGAGKCSVTLEWANGIKHRRSMTKSRGTKRERIDGDETVAFKSERDWQQRLGTLGTRQGVLRHLVAPKAWVHLLSGPGGGRPLRDLLASLMPESDRQDLLTTMMSEHGLQLREGHAGWSEKDVTAQRREARKAVSHAEGVLEASKAARGASHDAPFEPSPSAVAEAQTVLDSAAEWARYSSKRKVYEERLKARQHAEQAKQDHKKRLAEIGDNPGTQQLDPKQARRDANKARKKAADLQAEVVELQVRLAACAPSVSVQLPDDVEWTDAGALTDGASWTVVPSESGVTFHIDDNIQIDWSVLQALSAWRAEQSPKRASLEELLKNAERRQASAQAVAESAEEVAREADQHASEIAAYGQAIKALGAAPTVPRKPRKPAEPQHAEPGPARLEKARKVLADRDAAAAVQEDRQQQSNRADTAYGEAVAELQAAQIEATYWDALVEVMREAPSRAVQEGIKKLGDLGPVRISVGVDPAVTLTVDGVPWGLTSSGRRVVADAYLRAGLRRAAGLGWFPIFIDDAVLVGGQEQAPINEPKVVLVTTDEPAVQTSGM